MLAPETNTVIQHSGAVGKFIGELTVTWDGTTIADRKLRLLPISDKLPKSPTVAAIRDKYVMKAGAVVK